MLIMPLYKCKGSKQDPDNYRDISLIHSLGKLLAVLVLQKLEQHAQGYNCRAACQAGFHRNHRVEDNAIALASAMHEWLHCKEDEYFCVLLICRKHVLTFHING